MHIYQILFRYYVEFLNIIFVLSKILQVYSDCKSLRRLSSLTFLLKILGDKQSCYS